MRSKTATHATPRYILAHELHKGESSSVLADVLVVRTAVRGGEILPLSVGQGQGPSGTRCVHRLPCMGGRPPT